MSHIANKIVAKDKPLHSVFSESRYRIDAFQREFRWQHKQIDALISDLTTSFMANYSNNQSLADVENYDCYYMGPIVLCEDGSELSVVDGQQRLTSFTLLLMFLRHLQYKLQLTDEKYKELNNYLFVSRAGRKTMVLDVSSRQLVMDYLYNVETGVIDYSILEQVKTDKESNENLLASYDDILHIFPNELKNVDTLPMFIEWLLYKVVLVEIRAFNIDNAYTIFETMNDRGLSLNPTEILKAFVLSKIKNEEQSNEMNEFWKERISNIKFVAGSDGDLLFFRAWFRAKYAREISQGRIGDEKKDYDLIGSQFHTWFKNNQKLLHLYQSDDFYFFVKGDFDFYSKVFIDLFNRINTEGCNDSNNYYITSRYPMADSLYLALMFSPILPVDSIDIIEQKLTIVNKFTDVFINRRTLLGRSVNQSSIRRTVFEIIKKIRNVDVNTLVLNLQIELEKYNVESGLIPFTAGFSQNYVQYFHARIKYAQGYNDTFESLMRTKRQSSYVPIQILMEDDWNNCFSDEILSVSAWSIFNYCLCRRYDSKLIPEDSNKRIEWLVSKGYLPRYSNHYINSSQYLREHISRLEIMASSIVWPTKIKSTDEPNISHMDKTNNYTLNNMITSVEQYLQVDKDLLKERIAIEFVDWQVNFIIQDVIGHKETHSEDKYDTIILSNKDNTTKTIINILFSELSIGVTVDYDGSIIDYLLGNSNIWVKPYIDAIPLYKHQPIDMIVDKIQKVFDECLNSK